MAQNDGTEDFALEARARFDAAQDAWKRPGDADAPASDATTKGPSFDEAARALKETSWMHDSHPDRQAAVKAYEDAKSRSDSLDDEHTPARARTRGDSRVSRTDADGVRLDSGAHADGKVYVRGGAEFVTFDGTEYRLDWFGGLEGARAMHASCRK